MNIPSDPSVGYIVIILFLIGFFLFISGLNIIKIDKITVNHGFKTWFIGLILMVGSIYLGIHKRIDIEAPKSNKKPPNISVTKNDKEDTPDIEKLEDWYVWGKDYYKVRIDGDVFRSKPRSFSIEPLKKTEPGNGGLTFYLKPYKNYIGKNVHLKGYIKSESSTNAFIWLAGWADNKSTGEADVDVENNTDWRLFEIIYKVPKESETLSFGLNMGGGKGKIWIDDVEFKVVSDEVKEKSDRTHTKK